MRYIVLYIIAILWITTSESAAQKPTIGLLPSTHRQLHPEAVVDTISSPDSLIVVTPYPAKNTTVIEKQSKAASRDSLFPKRVARKSIEFNRPGIVPLIFKSLYPIRILINKTAINIRP